jgi:hypothetical protein
MKLCHASINYYVMERGQAILKIQELLDPSNGITAKIYTHVFNLICSSSPFGAAVAGLPNCG